LTGTEWPANFDDLDAGLDILDTNTLRILGQTDDPSLQNQLRDNLQLAEAATCALEQTYQEDPPPVSIPDQVLSPSTTTTTTTTATEIHTVPITSDNVAGSLTNGTGASTSSSSAVPFDDSPSKVSSPSGDSSTNNHENASNVTVQPPPPPPLVSSSSTTTTTTTTSPTSLTSNVSATAALPLNPSVAAIQAAYRHQTSVLGALPTANTLRSTPGAVYATTAGLANGLPGQIIYGGNEMIGTCFLSQSSSIHVSAGIPLDALRAYQTASGTPYAFATPTGQAMQQPALYAAQLQAIAQQQQQQQQAAQFAAAVKQQQQQQSLINSIPAGYALVRTANGGYALLAQNPSAATAAIPTQPAVQQQYISLNAAGQPTANGARLPMAMLGGQPQQIVYQYAGQPAIQAGPTQYIQLPANYAQQQAQVNSSLLPTAANAVASSHGSFLFIVSH
jgi:hypothetical protein